MPKITKEWCLAMAHRSEGEYINAGTRPDSDELETDASMFMRLITLLRKRDKLSIERFAQKADIDILDALQIEGNPNYRPSPRTVHKISEIFKMPSNALFQLSGVTENRDYTTPGNLLPFAACTTGKTEKLTKEELVALEQFVAIIVQKTR